MPRDLYLVSGSAVTMRAIIAAAEPVDDSLGVRALLRGAAIQLVDDRDVAVLTIENSRRLIDSSDAARLLPELRLAPGDAWWTVATAPWGEPGEKGVDVFERLAADLAGSCLIEDGE